MVRRQLARVVSVVFLALSWLSAQPSTVLACSCADGAPEWEVVFVGRVVAVVEGEWIQERLWLDNEGVGSTVALVEVELMWQGPERRFAVVIGGNAQGDCMLHFVPGARYVIAVMVDEPGLLDTNTCIGSRQMDDPAA